MAAGGPPGRRAAGAAVRRVAAGELTPDDPRPAPRWGLGDVAIGLAPFALGALIALGDGGDDDPVTLGSLVAGSVFLWVFLIGVPVFATKVKGAGLVRDLGLRFERADAAAFGLGVLLQAVVVPALYWPIVRLSDVSTDDVSNEARELVDSASGAGIVLLVVVVCVGAPFAEELFYRGLLLRSLDKRWGTAAALVGSTVLFGVAHLQGIQLPALLVFGAVAGTLAVRTGRLGPAILCHAGFNAWTVFQLIVLD